MSHIVGEIYLETFLNSKWSSGREIFNIFGDPALNIMANGFEVTQNVTVDTLTDISCRIRVHKCASVTIPVGGKVYFHTYGQLIIEEDGGLILQPTAHIYGKNGDANPVLRIRGGGFTAGKNVVFQDLPGGVWLENPKSEQDPPDFDGF